MKIQIPNDIPAHNQFIPAKNLESQDWLDEIEKWTLNQKMLINQKKTKCMVFNYTDNYKCSTRLQLRNETVEVIDSTKLLGTIIKKDLNWDLNTQSIVKKANARMQLLNVYILFIRMKMPRTLK